MPCAVQIFEEGFEYGILHFIGIRSHLVLGHPFLREVVTFIHLADKMKHLRLVGDDNVDHSALLLKLGKLTTNMMT
jgi:hypothetical protein